MYILYLDESGNPDDPSDRHFVLAGAAVFERVTHFLSRALDEVQTKHLPGLEPIAPRHGESRNLRVPSVQQQPEAGRLRSLGGRAAR